MIAFKSISSTYYFPTVNFDVSDESLDKSAKNLFFSPTAKLANNLLRTNGVLLRVRERHDDEWAEKFDQNGRDYMPAAFLHASMQAPNIIFHSADEGHSEDDPRVAFLIASKFERNLPSFDLQNVVDCRAYYPIDAFSEGRNEKIMRNKAGTSCTIQQRKIPNAEFFNMSNQ